MMQPSSYTSFQKGPDPYDYRYGDMQGDQPTLSEDVNKNLNLVMRGLDEARVVTGEQFFPGRSCEHIRRKNPGVDLRDGNYFISPDVHSEAFKVYCRFTKTNAETCLRPKNGVFEKKRWYDRQISSVWFVEDQTPEEMNEGLLYGISHSKLSLLQKYSDTARQYVTFKCDYVKAEGFQFMSNEESTEYMDTSSTRYRSSTELYKLENSCKSDVPEGRTIIEIKTKRPENLPIKDILVFDLGASNQQLGIEVSEVCFMNA